MAEKHKQKLILGQKKEPREGMEFDPEDRSRPDPGIQRRIERGDIPYYQENLPEPEEPYERYSEKLGSEAYKKAIKKVSERLPRRPHQQEPKLNVGPGLEGGFYDMYMGQMNVLSQLVQLERPRKTQLEELAKKLIRRHFGLTEEDLILDFKLVYNIPVENAKTEREIQQKVQIKQREFEDKLDKITLARAKRRLADAMIQGSSVDEVYLFEKIPNILSSIFGNDEVTKKYSVLTSIVMLGYWQMGDQAIQSATSRGAGGKTRIDKTTNPPTIHAEALTFPILIHEGLKGVNEYMIEERTVEDEEVSLLARELEDQVIYEAWDIRLGPIIFEKIMKTFPLAVLKRKERRLKSYLLSNLFNLPANEFLLYVVEAFEGTELGKRLVAAMYYDLKLMLDNEDVDPSQYHFRTVMDQIIEKHKTASIDDLINQLGITDED